MEDWSNRPPRDRLAGQRENETAGEKSEITPVFETDRMET